MEQEMQYPKMDTFTTVVCGVDIVDIESFERLLKFGGEGFLRRVYTATERECYSNKISRLAARFAAKEAVSKALGTGIRGISLSEIEVLSDQYGCPFVSLYGHAALRAEDMRLTSWSISLSHGSMQAIAMAVALCQVKPL